MNTDDVRRMLERRAGDVSPAPDAWDAIEDRLAHTAPGPPRLRSRPALLAAVLVVLVGVAAVAVSRPDRTERVALRTGGQADGSPDRAGGATGTTSPDLAATAPDHVPATTAPAPAGPPDVPTAVGPPPTTTAAPHPPGTAPTPTSAPASAPVLLSAAATVTERQGGYAAGTITVTFDQPVNLGTAPLSPMYVVVFKDDATCATPAGNGQRVISGAGTPTLTLDATSLATPVTFITLAPGFVTGVTSGLPNEPLGCTAVPTSLP